MALRRFHRTTAAVMVLSLMMAACDDGGHQSADTTTPTTPTTPTGPGGPSADGEAPRLFGLRLAEGEALTTPTEPAPVVAGDGIDGGRIDEILARLPDWQGGESEQVPFNWPVQSVPPPRTGALIDEVFPPATSTPPEEVPTGPLHVLRYLPEGDVPVAPYVSVTFDQPMVPVGTVGDVDAADVPVTIEPAVPGHWQWIGTRTLRFDHDSDEFDRMPMATTFTVTVPAGTASATGGELAEAVSWTFTTPPPSVVSFWPQDSNSMPLDQLFTAVFDQRIDPAAVLTTVHVTAGDAEMALRLATDDEVQADDTARNIAAQTAAGRLLAFRAVDPLPTDAAITVTVGPDTPSAEGPARSTQAAIYRNRTYAPLRIERVTCDWGDECPPGSQLAVEFNNPLDTDRTDPALVAVSPAIPGQRIGLSSYSIVISGATQARTTYEVTLPASVTDVFGQTLGESRTVTIDVGSAPKSVQSWNEITTLDPFAEGQQLSVWTVNHDEVRVRVFAADPSMYAEYEEYSYRRDEPGVALPAWTVLSDETIDVDGDADTTVATAIDLAGALDGEPGQVIVLVEPVPSISPQSDQYWQNRPALTWAQSTRLGVDVLSDADEAVAWVTDLRTGAPVRGAMVQYEGTVQQATTDGDGVAHLPLPPADPNKYRHLLIATSGDDTAILPVYSTATPVRDAARWYVFDDRQIYRPGETMKVKGWVRRLTLTGDATLQAPGDGAGIRYTVTDAYGNAIADGTADVGALGGFDLSIDLPETADLGTASLTLELTGTSGLDSNVTQHSFQIQQYRRPEFEVTTAPESEPPFVSTSPATVAAKANYYAGGPLVGSPVDWLVTTREGTYSPPGWDEFTFGIWTPWWSYDVRGGADMDAGYYEGDAECCGPIGETTVEQYGGTTDDTGTHYLQIGFEGDDGVLPDLPVLVHAEATVTDVNRQAWASSSDLLVHPADRYVGLRTSRAFVREGDPLTVDVIVTGIDGTALPGVGLTVTAGRVEWVYTDGEWGEQVLDTTTCDVTSAAEPVPCTFDAPIGGQYRVTAVVADEHGGRSRTQLTTWVTGAGSRPSTDVAQESLTVVPDKADYEPGDTAELLVQSPFTTGTGLLTVSRNGVQRTETFTLDNGSAVIRIPITEADVPSLSIGMEVVGATARTGLDGAPQTDLPDRPAYAVGGLTLPVSLASRTLDVTVATRDDAVLPGGSTTIDVTVKDGGGAPVQGAEMAVVVVDEAVLALTGYELPDPLQAFYGSWYEYLDSVYGRSLIRLLDNDLIGGRDDEGTAETSAASETTMAPAAPGDNSSGGGEAQDGGDKDESSSGAIDVRSDFDALALFEPSVTTGADGTAEVALTLPDSLTRYRVMVVAVGGDDQFGSAETDLTARLPLSVRPSAPRFANFGDQFELPVVVQNLGDAALSVDVVLETSNLAPDTPAGQRVDVPANGRVEVRFPVSTVQAGTAAFRVAAVGGEWADAAVGSFPVYTPATAEAFATYGTIDDGAVLQPIAAPDDVISQFGGLEITTSSTSLQALTDAVLYVTRYRYDSSDGMASRIMSIAALQDVLDAFDVEGMPTRAEIDETMSSDIDGLAGSQLPDGGWGWWSRAWESLPFHTVQVTHALLLARQRGYEVPQATLDQALAYLADVESHIPAEYGQAERDSIRAYALWVRDLAGQRDPQKALALYRERGDDLGADALAWLWGSLDDAAAHADVERLLNNRAVETAGEANFTTSYDDTAYMILSSDRRTDGIVLDALIAESPGSDLIPKVVNGLLAHRVQGRWDDIQENAFILLALHRYFVTFESQTPDFVARVWLGDQYAGDHTFAGRETDRVRFDLPMSDVQEAGDTDLVLAKDGTGRLYYRIGMRYAPADLHLDALDRGFVVSRRYEGVDDPADVWLDDAGVWHVKAGARVRVVLDMVAESQRTQVALVDPLPAGLESLNPDLEVTQTIPSMEGEGPIVPLPVDGAWCWWGWGTWYEHQQLRDDRTEAFTTLLPAGTYQYTYVARATTPGRFVVPPTRAEQVYAPETFGRTATDTVVVEG